MVRSATTIPHVTNFDDADITDLDRLRKNVPANYLGANVKLTSMPFVIKAVATALLRHPLLNSSLDEESQQIVFKQYVHLGIAVDTPRGLIVPVMRNVDRMGIPEIARDLAMIAERARQAQFAIEDLARRHLYVQQHRRRGRDVQHAHHQPSRSGRVADRPLALAAGGAGREDRAAACSCP